MSLTQLVTLILLNVAGAASPGPDILLITRIATKSRKHALATVAGIQTGVLFWCTITVVGAAAVLTAFPALLGLIQLLGGSWIIILGIRMFRVGWANRTSPPVDLESAAADLGSLKRMYIQGLTTNLANPKIVLFLAALIAPLLPPEPSVVTSIVVILALSISAALLQLVIAFSVSTMAVRRRLLRAGPWIDVGSGLFFIVVGTILAIAGATALL